VDGVWEPVAGGPPRWRERNADEMERIAALARSAVGFDERRGDKVEVVSLRFAEPPPADLAPEGFVILGQTVPTALMGRVVESAILALVALAAILLLGRPLVGRLGVALAPPPALAAAGAGALPGGIETPGALPGGGPAALGAGGAPALPGASGEGAAPADDRMVNVERVDGQMRASALQALADLVDANPDQSAAVLRRWLTPQDDD
jgi:flagellar M-ring protein FliF